MMTALSAQAIPYVGLHRLTVAQYHAMIVAGIVTPADRIELLEGLLVEKIGKKPTHSQITQIIRSLFERLLPMGWHGGHFTLVHRYDFITGKRADIRRGDSWGWGFFHERLIRPYIYVDETIGVGNKKQTRPIVVRCPQRRSL